MFFSTAIIIILIISMVSGCISIDDKKEEKTPEESTYWDRSSHDGAMMTPDGTKSYTGDHNLNILLAEIPIRQIILNITYEDGHPNTEPDIIHGSIITGTDSNGNEVSDTIPGGTMPYSDQFILISNEGTHLMHEFLVVDDFTCNPGEDTWPGPFIWRGIEDDGFLYHIDLSVEYLCTQEEWENLTGKQDT